MSASKEKAKKAREWSHLQSFRACLGNFPTGVVHASEVPDFIVHTSGAIIGIEHMEIFSDELLGNGSPLMAREGDRLWIVQEVRRLCQERRLAPIDVRVDFLDYYPLPRQRRQAAAVEIANCIELLLPIAMPTVVVEQQPRRNSPLPKEVHRIRVERLAPGNGYRIHHPSAGYYTKLSADQVAARISKKETRIGAYRGNCTAIWLLLVIYGSNASSLIDIPRDLLDVTFSTRFDRVFILNHFEGKLIELETARTKPTRVAEPDD